MVKKRVSQEKARQLKPAATKAPTKNATKSNSAKRKSGVKKLAANEIVAAAKKVVPPKKPPRKADAASAKKSVARQPGSPRTGETIKGRPSSKKIAKVKRLHLAPGIDVGDRITAIVQEWANAQSEPANDAVLSTLWATSGVDAPFTNGAQDLVRRLNEDLGSRLRPTDITTATMVSDLIQMIV